MGKNVNIDKQYVKESRALLSVTANYSFTETKLSGTLGGLTVKKCNDLSEILSMSNKSGIPIKEKQLIENTRNTLINIGVSMDETDKQLAATYKKGNEKNGNKGK